MVHGEHFLILVSDMCIHVCRKESHIRTYHLELIYYLVTTRQSSRIIKYKGIMLKKVARCINYSDTIPSILLGTGATGIYWFPKAALQAALRKRNT
jgi:hypothetical protein